LATMVVVVSTATTHSIAHATALSRVTTHSTATTLSWVSIHVTTAHATAHSSAATAHAATAHATLLSVVLSSLPHSTTFNDHVEYDVLWTN